MDRIGIQVLATAGTLVMSFAFGIIAGAQEAPQTQTVAVLDADCLAAATTACIRSNFNETLSQGLSSIFRFGPMHDLSVVSQGCPAGQKKIAVSTGYIPFVGASVYNLASDCLTDEQMIFQPLALTVLASSPSQNPDHQHGSKITILPPTQSCYMASLVSKGFLVTDDPNSCIRRGRLLIDPSSKH